MADVEAVECTLSEDNFAAYTDYVVGRTITLAFRIDDCARLFAVPTLYTRWHVGDRLVQWDDSGLIAVFCALEIRGARQEVVSNIAGPSSRSELGRCVDATFAAKPWLGSPRHQ